RCQNSRLAPLLEPLLSTSKDGVRTTGAICLILALSDQSSLCKIAATHLNNFAKKSFTSIRTMSAQKRPLTALSTAETAAAVKMIIVPSNNQTLRVGSTIRVITPTSGQVSGQAMIVSKPMTIQHTPSETGQTAVHANKTATKSLSNQNQNLEPHLQVVLHQKSVAAATREQRKRAASQDDFRRSAKRVKATTQVARLDHTY
ncbi:hypothetical protein TYRP_006003, partial [Tyrophagus putrescentiae]